MTHAGERARSRSSGVRRILLRLLLVVLFAGGLATLAPGIASADGEQVIGTIQTSRSGPIKDVQITWGDILKASAQRLAFWRR